MFLCPSSASKPTHAKEGCLFDQAHIYQGHLTRTSGLLRRPERLAELPDFPGVWKVSSVFGLRPEHVPCPVSCWLFPVVPGSRTRPLSEHPICSQHEPASQLINTAPNHPLRNEDIARGTGSEREDLFGLLPLRTFSMFLSVRGPAHSEVLRYLPSPLAQLAL